MIFLAALADTCARLLHATADACDAFAHTLTAPDVIPDTVPEWMNEEADL